jgi:hypothetical protein
MTLISICDIKTFSDILSETGEVSSGKQNVINREFLVSRLIVLMVKSYMISDISINRLIWDGP